jgi:hypothetical protein
MTMPANPGKFARICEYLSSSHDGERAAAAYKASAMLGRAGLTWTDACRLGRHFSPTRDRPRDADSGVERSSRIGLGEGARQEKAREGSQRMVAGFHQVTDALGR